ncbi:MAG: uracil-DNA glycosylase [bacterium]
MNGGSRVRRSRSGPPPVERAPLKDEAMFRELEQQVNVCVKCELSKSRTNAVFGEGAEDARIMFIGEGPGQEEDVQGRPFVGRAGKLLTQMLEEIGIRREDVYITNIVKCRPPGNRDPLPKESLACRDYLMAQIAYVEPEIVCALGRVALQALLGQDVSISSIHGQGQRWKGMLFVPIYHPAAGLRSASMMKGVRDDFAKLKKIIERNQ